MAKPKETRITPATLLMDDHWRRMGLDREWTKDEVLGLCKAMKVTPWELGRLFCIPMEQMGFWLRKGRFPTYVSLNFHLLREWLKNQTFGSAEMPCVPVDLVMFGG